MTRNSQHKVRVIAGSLRGRRLSYPEDNSARPTMQRTKSSVFETIKGSIPGCVYADLYCASGGMGIEALSRGAAFVHFVERDRRQLAALRENLDLCGVSSGAYRIHAMDVDEALSSSLKDAQDLQIVFADPPYGAGDLQPEHDVVVEPHPAVLPHNQHRG